MSCGTQVESGKGGRHDVDVSLYRLAENIAYTVCSNPNVLVNNLPMRDKGTLQNKLLDLYLEQFSQRNQTTFASNPRACSNLLSKLIAREKLKTLVINLKPLDHGYSISIRSANGRLIETANQPYTEKDLLNFLEQEELPHNLVDLLDQAQPELFYDGCVIAEIRDGRRAVNGAYKTSYVLLKPSHREDRFTLESKLLLATNEPLCLEPSPVVSIIRNRLSFKKKFAQTETLRRAMKPYTSKGLLKRRTFRKLSLHKELPVYEFLKARGNKSKYLHSRDPHIKTPVVDSWKTQEVSLSPVNTSEVQKLAKELERPICYNTNTGNTSSANTKQRTVDCTPVVVEEYTMETERPAGRLHRSRLIILKKPSDDRFIGELYIDRSEWSSNKCVFELGTAPLKDKYINQFIEIFTEEGRKQVKIVHTLPGQAPRVIYTSGPNSQGSTTPKPTQSQIHLSASASSSNQTIRYSSDNQSAIRFSLTSQPGAISSVYSQDDSAVAAQSMSSSTDSSGSSLMLGRQGLKIQGNILTTSHVPQSATDHTLLNTERTSSQTMKVSVPATSKSSLSNLTALSKTNLLVSRSATTGQLTQLSANQGHKLIGLQNVQGLHNVQVSLTSIGQGGTGIAVPVSLFSGITGNQPIFLSGPLPMVDNAGKSQQQVSSMSQTSGAVMATPRPIIVTTTQAGHQGLITLPVNSTLAQQILAANKQRQPQQQQQLNVVNAQQLANQQISSQVQLTNQHNAQQTTHMSTHQKPANIQIGQLLSNQHGSIQISHLPSNQQAPLQIGHQILTQQNSGNLHVRSSQPSVSRSASMQVFRPQSVLQGQQAPAQVTPQHINIISAHQTAPSSQQILHIPQSQLANITSQLGQGNQQLGQTGQQSQTGHPHHN